MTLTAASPIADQAAEFIETSEAQAILKLLAQYNLGIQLLHVHPSKSLPVGTEFDDHGFAPLPEGYVVLEENCQVSFCPSNQVPENVIATGWAWNGVSAACVSSCVPNPAHGHVQHHQSQNPQP